MTDSFPVDQVFAGVYRDPGEIFERRGGEEVVVFYAYDAGVRIETGQYGVTERHGKAGRILGGDHEHIMNTAQPLLVTGSG